jgi:hypothetical protein
MASNQNMFPLGLAIGENFCNRETDVLRTSEEVMPHGKAYHWSAQIRLCLLNTRDYPDKHI